MDPRQFQRSAREFFAADNALRAAPVPTDAHVESYVVARIRHQRAIEQAEIDLTEPIREALGPETTEPEEEEQDGGD